MWLFTSLGFFSVVAHRDDPASLLVRARAREDLEALRDRYLPDLDLVENAGSDYRWRAFVPRDGFRDVAARLIADIDYPNFKNAVADRQGHHRAHLYGDVWQTMYGLQRDGG